MRSRVITELDVIMILRTFGWTYDREARSQLEKMRKVLQALNAVGRKVRVKEREQSAVEKAAAVFVATEEYLEVHQEGKEWVAGVKAMKRAYDALRHAVLAARKDKRRKISK